MINIHAGYEARKLRIKTNFRTLASFLILLMTLLTVNAHGEETLGKAAQIIESKTPCNNLTEEQLENIGEFYMEEMHPGEAHEAMDEMMGGEGSESLRQMHIALAKRIYCNDINGMANNGMMSMMMGGGMMNMAMGTGMMGNFGNGMMGNYGFSYLGFLNFLSLILIIGLIILVYLWIIKIWKDLFRKKTGKIK